MRQVVRSRRLFLFLADNPKKQVIIVAVFADDRLRCVGLPITERKTVESPGLTSAWSGLSRSWLLFGT